MSTLKHFFKPSGDGSSSSTAVPVSTFLVALKEVAKEQEITTFEKRRGSYTALSEELKAKVANMHWKTVSVLR